MKNSYHKEIFDRIPQKRRNKIINVAVHEFARKGFNNANINEIAAAAGISVGSIYKYFNTKEDLFLTCVHFGVETLEAVLDEVIASPGDLFVLSLIHIYRFAVLERGIKIADLRKDECTAQDIMNMVSGKTG